MDLQKLNPWNWFKHEDREASKDSHIPVARDRRGEYPQTLFHPDSLLRLHSEMDRLFDEAFSAFGMPTLRSNISSQLAGPGSRMLGAYRPQIDVSGDDRTYQITLDVPGLSEQELNIEVSGDVLTIKGQKEEHVEEKDKQFYRMERSYGVFRRTLALPDDADADAIEASLKDGVLTLNIPRRQLDKSEVKRISISS